jgi:hypothetical protein
MQKATFLTLFSTFDDLETVSRTLPTVLAESSRHDARVLVHDCSVTERDAKWAYLRELSRQHEFHLILSSPVSMAQSRNMCLALGVELFSPDYVCAIDDDHGYHEGFIPAMIDAMRDRYHAQAPSGLRYGLFTGCGRHYRLKDAVQLPDGHITVSPDAPPDQVGRANNCCRCAPTLHWLTVLRGWDVDGYPVSNYQCRNLNLRNYHRGFTSLLVGGGRQMFVCPRTGRGMSGDGQRRWDETYAAQDARARYRR